MPCGNQNQNTNYVKAGRPGIALTLLGGGANSNGGSGMEGGATRERNRFTLRNAWNGEAAKGVVNGYKTSCTPFRAVYNAGDLLSRQYYTSGGSNQVNTGRIRRAANLAGNFLGGAIKPQANPTKIPSASTNVKYVYDSSNYTTFKKLQAVGRNYNDSSYGGSNNSSQSAWRAIRRY